MSHTEDIELQQNLFLKLWQQLSEITEIFLGKLAEISLEEKKKFILRGFFCWKLTCFDE